MYVNYFGLTKKPFQITTDPTFLWLGEKHKEALATLRYGILENRGFLLLTGEVGTGKTIIVNKLISLLDIDTIVATLSDPDLACMDFYKLLADSLKINRPFHSKADFLIYFRKFLYQCHAKHKQVLLIIDESQRLKHHLMEEIRVLSNIELQDRKLINIFFVGQPEFNGMLMTPKNRALSQRISVRYNIEPLDQQETYYYINHRLRVAGSKKPIFQITALKEIFLFSGGIPRLINIVGDHALLTAFSKNLKRVDGNIIRECAEELRIPFKQVQSNVATFRTEEEVYSNIDAGNGHNRHKIQPDRKKTAATQLKGWKAISVSEMPKRWKLLFYGGIFLLLSAFVIAIIQNAGSPIRREGNADITSKKNMSAKEDRKEWQSGHLSHTKQKQGKQRPVSASTASGKVAVNDAIAKSKSESLRKEEIVPAVRIPISRNHSKVLEDRGKFIISEGRSKPGPLSVDESEVNEETQIGSLPLLKEKVVIQFDFNSNEIEDGSYAALNRIAHYLMEHPKQRIIIRGYTDSSGSASFNETVAGFRANAVKSYLIAKGVKADKMTTHALGAFNPVASNETPTGRRSNRRVEIEFVEIQQ